MHPVHTPLKRRARIKPDGGPTELGCRSLITGRVGGFSASVTPLPPQPPIQTCFPHLPT